MGRRRGNTFWTVPFWEEDSVVNGPGIPCDATGNVILTLLSALDFEDRPVFVKRIIGQYNHITNGSAGNNRLVHHRIYVADMDLATTDVDAGTLDTALGAERSFLWHEIGFLPPTLSGSLWEPMGTGTAARTIFARNGAFDITVGRKIGGTDCLLWHSLAVGAAGPEMALQLWVRLLCEEVD